MISQYITLLNVRSEYSFFNSLIKIKEYINFANINHLKTLAIIDHNNIHGAIEFYFQCLKNKIKPIIGLNCNFNFQNNIFNVNFLIKNTNGLYSLMILISLLDQQKNILDLKKLKKNNFHNLILIFNLNNQSQIKIIKLFCHFYEINFQENIFFGLSNFLNNNEDNLWTDRYKEKIIFNPEINYLFKNQKDAYTNLVFLKNKTRRINHHFHYLSLEEIKLNYLDSLIFKNSLKNLQNLILKINFTWPKIFSLDIFNFQELLAKNNTSLKFITNLCQKRLVDLKLEDNAKYQQRLKFELQQVEKFNFINYFLIVYDFIQYSKKNQIMIGFGRGSAAGSLISYLLNISKIDPIKYNLIFSRFLNQYRNNFADIDVDVEDEKRMTVLKYLQDKYQNHFGLILTFQTFKFNSLCLELSNLYQLSNIEKEALVNNKQFYLFLKNHNYNDFLKFLKVNKMFRYLNQKYKNLFLTFFNLYDLKKSTSTHASGFLVAKSELWNYICSQKNFNNLAISHFDSASLEKINLVKFDLLALRYLTILRKIISWSKLKKLPSFDYLNHDLKTFTLLNQGDTLGIFQLQSKYLKNILKYYQLKNFHDLIVLNALLRPGPKQQIDSYIYLKKHNKIKIYDSLITKFLKPTNGIIIFQEQILEILRSFAHLSYQNCEKIRYAISKKKINLIQETKTYFFKNALALKRDQEAITKIWNLILKFSNYAFNKAHASCYSLLSYYLAYFKAHEPKVFFTVYLNEKTFWDLHKFDLIQKFKHYNLKLSFPSLNNNVFWFEFGVDNKIFIPLKYFKNMSWKFLNALNLNQFTILNFLNSKNINVFLFVSFLKKYFLSWKDLQTLIIIDYFKKFKINKSILLYNIDLIYHWNNNKNFASKHNMIIPKLMKPQNLLLEEIINLEYQNLGFILSKINKKTP